MSRAVPPGEYAQTWFGRVRGPAGVRREPARDVRPPSQVPHPARARPRGVDGPGDSPARGEVTRPNSEPTGARATLRGGAHAELLAAPSALNFAPGDEPSLARAPVSSLFGGRGAPMRPDFGPHFLIASEDEAATGALAIPLDGVEAFAAWDNGTHGLGPEQLGELHCIVLGRVLDYGVLDGYQIVFTHDEMHGPWLIRIPDEFVSAWHHSKQSSLPRSVTDGWRQVAGSDSVRLRRSGCSTLEFGWQSWHGEPLVSTSTCIGSRRPAEQRHAEPGSVLST